MSPWGLIFSWISCCVEWKAGQHQLANSSALCVIKMYSVNIYWVTFGTLEVEGVNKTAGTPAPSRFSFGGREAGLGWDRQGWRDWGLRGGWGSALAKVRPRGGSVKRVRSGKRQQERRHRPRGRRLRLSHLPGAVLARTLRFPLLLALWKMLPWTLAGILSSFGHSHLMKLYFLLLSTSGPKHTKPGCLPQLLPVWGDGHTCDVTGSSHYKLLEHVSLWEAFVWMPWAWHQRADRTAVTGTAFFIWQEGWGWWEYISCSDLSQ